MQIMAHQTAGEIAAAYTAAWNSGKPDAVADFFTPDGTIVINNGQPWRGRAGVAAMAAGFFADIPDLCLVCDGVRTAGSHVAYLWTFTGTHLASGNPVRVTGWEEWDIDPQGAIVRSCGWFDADDYSQQTTAAAV
jgi:uncharacterized protein (TIGR02246 family)